MIESSASAGDAMDLRFGPAGVGDAAAAMAIYRGNLGTPGCTWEEDYPNGETLISDLATGSMYALREGDRLVAVASLGDFRELADLSWSRGDLCELSRLGVAPDRQGRGYGARLLAELIRVAKAQGYEGIRMLVHVDNGRALRLYRRAGFAALGTAERFGMTWRMHERIFEAPDWRAAANRPAIPEAVSSRLSGLWEPPPLYSRGADSIWTDPHLSKGMLEAHLNDSHDAASYRRERREALIDGIDRRFLARDYPRVLDLGCGPGLYANELARRGRRVFGIDLSERSIARARADAGDGARFAVGDYTDEGLDFGGPRDLAMMISWDYGVLSPPLRARLARRVLDSLRPGGAFLLDARAAGGAPAGEGLTWETGSGGYWSEGAYLLSKGLWAYGGGVTCERIAALDAVGLREFRIWEKRFEAGELRGELLSAGFREVEVGPDPAGAPFRGGEALFAFANK